MTGFTDADNRAFFAPAVWGSEALINGTLAVDGILDESYVDPLGLAATAPVFSCASVDYPDALAGDVLDIGDRRWIVETVEPDGTGVTLMRLRKVD
jgi:hypothetical protein